MNINWDYLGSAYSSMLTRTTNQSAFTSLLSADDDSTTSQTASSALSDYSAEVLRKYDEDGDGTLSQSELAAMLRSMSSQQPPPPRPPKAEEASGEMDGAMQMPPGPPPDVSEMSDDDLKAVLTVMKDRTGSLPEELSAYEDISTDDLTADDLEEIRAIMLQKQEEMEAEREAAREAAKANQTRLYKMAISQYDYFSAYSA